MEDGWIEWKGGAVDADPVAGELIEVEYRYGDMGQGCGNSFAWDHVGIASDIIAYRVIGA